ncbi:MAG: hypothetical protein JWO31_734 [Phycisphaerales bacterium]|nr:hypothetical protein [Phycisphaerales bacterium]
MSRGRRNVWRIAAVAVVTTVAALVGWAATVEPLATLATPVAAASSPAAAPADAIGAAAAAAGGIRFAAVDVFVDPGDRPLAAYQFTLRAVGGTALLVGLEGGDAPAFAAPPYYDPAALVGEQVVVAALSTADDLPRGRTRVARLHVQVTGPTDPRYEVALHVAAGPDGRALDGVTATAVVP